MVNDGHKCDDKHDPVEYVYDAKWQHKAYVERKVVGAAAVNVKNTTDEISKTCLKMIFTNLQLTIAIVLVTRQRN